MEQDGAGGTTSGAVAFYYSSLAQFLLDAGVTLMRAGFQCAGCGEWNDTSVDESAGASQSYVEDCQVCCKPNVLAISYDRESGEFLISAQLEDA